MKGRIRLRSFRREGHERLFRSYMALKYEVFVKEQGWSQLADESGLGVARPDPFDAWGRFLLARTEDGVPIGVVRGMALKDGFPHRELFEHHLQRAEVSRMLPKLCTFNALAVLPAYRRAKYEVMGCKREGTVATLLMLEVIGIMQREGMQGAVATAGSVASARLCSRLGFLFIDPPGRTSLHPEFLMTNVGIVFGSPAHVRVQEESGIKPFTVGPPQSEAADLLHYFNERQHVVLGSMSLDSFFLRL
jgi:hypothetical protein